ncbi:unnamed protein product [Brachionus calyciflorus]|uniref:DUF4200 domain-containing protein n=1 Tax=Brachionus calyciflorus TaxID=104777 RepID=A0A813YYN9_9BILA|nr:unnamed protein product [Brachionus calyciflorus]
MTMAISEQDNEMVRNLIRKNIISLINDKQQEVENPKKIFLTQFNEKEDEDGVTEIKQLNTGKTGVLKEGLEFKLQRNILAKYRFDEDKVTKALSTKRQEFENRINICQEKHANLLVKQEKNQQLIKQYSQFINEKEAIRKRAIAKYQTELKLRLQKMLEYDILMKQLEEVKQKHDIYTKKVENNKKYKNFLSKVIEMLPENYLEAGESKYTSLMMRHQTLYDTNLDLFKNLISNSDKLKVLRNQLERLVIDHNSNKMTFNSKLGELMQLKEEIELSNSRAEESLLKDGDKKRERVLEMSRVMWGIDNLAEKSFDKRRYANKPLESMNVFEKLECIKSYISKTQDIYKMVKNLEQAKTPV